MKKLMILGVMFPLIVTGQNYSAEPVAHITTKLGVTVNFKIFNNGNLLVRENESFEEWICYRNDAFCLEIKPNIFIAIPISSLKEAHLNNGLHTVKLKNGDTLVGRLLGALHEDRFVAENENREPRKYNFESINQFNLSGIDNKSGSRDIGTDKSKWQYVEASTNVDTFSLKNLNFFFTYVYSARRNEGVFYHYENETELKSTASFDIQTEDGVSSAYITDFTALAFNTESKCKITLTSPIGVKTTGFLILKEDDHPASEFALVADIVNCDGCKLILSNPNCLIKKTNPNAKVIR